MSLFRRLQSGFLPVVAGLILFSASSTASAANPARTLLLEKLAAQEMELGVDEEDGESFLAEGSAGAICPSGSTPAQYLTARETAARIALLRAKRSISEYLGKKTSANRELDIESRGGNRAKRLHRDIASETASRLVGCQPVAFAEAEKDGKLYFSVAVLWSPSVSEAVAAALEDESVASPWLSPEDSARFEQTVQANQEAFLGVSSRLFQNPEDGRIWFSGIGTVPFNAASPSVSLGLARQKAIQNLSYAVFSDIAAKKSLVSDSLDISGEDGVATEREKKLDEIMGQKIKGRIVPGSQTFLLGTAVEMSGANRKATVFVSALPLDQAGKAIRSFESNGTAEEIVSNRPVSRPDHSFRPASNRPEYPNRHRRSVENDGDDRDDGDDTDF